MAPWSPFGIRQMQYTPPGIQRRKKKNEIINKLKEKKEEKEWKGSQTCIDTPEAIDPPPFPLTSGWHGLCLC